MLFQRDGIFQKQIHELRFDKCYLKWHALEIFLKMLRGFTKIISYFNHKLHNNVCSKTRLVARIIKKK